MHHETFHPAYKTLIESKGYYDAFLINLAGDIVYSVFKENDFGTNMMTGPFKDSGLADVYRSARGRQPRRGVLCRHGCLMRPLAAPQRLLRPRRL